MATLTYAYTPGTVVYHVDEATGVNVATVSSVSVIKDAVEEKLRYQLLFTQALTVKTGVVELDLFADVDLALAEYKLRHLT